MSAFCADDAIPFSSSSTRLCQSRTFSRYERRSSSSIDRLGSFDRSRESYGADGAQVALVRGGPDPAPDAGRGPRKANGTRAQPRSGRPSWPDPDGHYTAARTHFCSRFLAARRRGAHDHADSDRRGFAAHALADGRICLRWRPRSRWGRRRTGPEQCLQDPTPCGGTGKTRRVTADAAASPLPAAGTAAPSRLPAALPYCRVPPTRRAISCDCAHWSAKFLAAAPLQVIFQNDWSCWTASFFFGGLSSA